MPTQTAPQQKVTDVPRKMSPEEVAQEEQKKLDLEQELANLRLKVNSLRAMITQLQEIHGERPSRTTENAIANIKIIMLEYLLDEHEVIALL